MRKWRRSFIEFSCKFDAYFQKRNISGGLLPGIGILPEMCLNPNLGVKLPLPPLGFSLITQKRR